ncbi:glycolipid transfer protein 1-like isoform X2 [Brassica rapa]|nr:glycolipid transfer protein 1-like isoform X2 [Brassica rapa]
MLSCVVSKHGNVIIISEISSFVLVFSSVKSWKMEGTVFTPCLEGMKHVKSEQGEMLTMPFLDLCKTLFPVLDKFGAAMTIVKSDISGNITRLEKNYLSDPDKYKYLYTIVQGEIESGTAKGSSSCTNGLLWLTRAMDFLVELCRNLVAHQDWSMSQACGDSYQKTLKKWHGWFASSTSSMGLKLAPDRKKFMEVTAGSGDINADMERFFSEFGPLLQENHKFLASVGMDDMKAA